MADRRIGPGAGVLLQLGAALAVLCVLLAMIEVAARVYLATATPPPVLAAGDYVTNTMRAVALAPDKVPVPVVADAQLLWRNEPYAVKTQPINPRPLGTDRTWTLRNDSRGYRGAEVPARTPGDGSYRVLCVGDSITYGFNVDQDETYPVGLERLLRAAAPGRRIDVVDAGVSGWSWVQGRTFLEREGLGLAPDAVVMGHGSNDRFFPAKTTDRERLAEAGTPWGRVRGWLGDQLVRAAAFRLLLYFTPPRPDLPESPGCRGQSSLRGGCKRVGLDEITDEVRRVRELTRARGVDLVVINVDFMGTDAVRGVRAAVDADGIPFLDLVDDFTARRVAAEHQRAAAHELADAAVARPDDARRQRTVILRVHSAAPGRISVHGDHHLGTVTFDVPLYDDATHGDETALDGVWSTTLTVPADVGAIAYKFFRDGRPELEPLPPFPSTQSLRVLDVPGDVVAPIAEFGELHLMAERTHPNAEGQRVIAERVAAAVRDLPSFRRVAGVAAGAPGR